MAQLLNILKIKKWLSESAGRDAVFVSIRFKTSPKSKDELCARCKRILLLAFRKLLGRRWHKIYHKRFFLMGFQEYGLSMHAHFVIGAQGSISTSAFTAAMKSLSHDFEMDVWDSEEDKAQNPKRYGGDIMIKDIYSDGVFSYAIKDIRFDGYKITTDTLITGACLFGQ